MRLVQPIVVKPSTHFETIAAVALASGLALAQADTGAEPWASWLGASFTKSVRRTKRDAELAKARLLGIAQAEITIGGATAIAFAPMDADGFPPPIKRLQVTGLDLQGQGEVPAATSFSHPTPVVPSIELNADVAMSSGKAAAQAAHALGAWLLAQPASVREAWAAEPGLHLATTSFAADAGEPSCLVIVDNGLTEIAPGTPTARLNTRTPVAR